MVVGVGVVGHKLAQRLDTLSYNDGDTLVVVVG